MEKDMKNIWIKIAAAAAGICICSVVVHNMALGYFRTHYLPNTVIDIQDSVYGGGNEDAGTLNIGYMTEKEAEDALSSLDTVIGVVERNGCIEYIYGNEIHLHKDIAPCLSSIMSAQEGHIGEWWKYAAGTKVPDAIDDIPWNDAQWTYDADLLSDAIDDLDIIRENGEAPEDAYIIFEDGKFSIVDEKDGCLADAQKVKECVANGIINKQMLIDVDEGGCYAAPSVTHEDGALVAEAERLNHIVTKNVHIDVIGDTEVVTPQTYLPWVSYNNGEIGVDTTAVEEYVTEMSKKYKTYLTQRNFTTTGGDTITVGGDRFDTYGFWMNIDDMTTILADAVRTATEDIVVDAPWKVPARARNAPNGDIGDTYVEVSIDAQHLWYYVDGEPVMDFDVVTGMDTASRRTPTGVFRILWKDTEHTMKGSYGSSFCHFWMPVTWEGVGIHDAYWRSSYGGDIWRYNGSHGCVNVSYENAKALYESVAIDTPVIIY